MQRCILSFNNREQVLELPVPLQQWEVSSPHNTYSFTTLEKGDINAIGKTKLKTLTIVSFFPSKHYPFLVTKDFPEPFDCVAMIESWRLKNRPIRVVIVGTDINLAMVIKDFKHGRVEYDGSDDVTFTLSLEEYRFANIDKVEADRKINAFTGLRERSRSSV